MFGAVAGNFLQRFAQKVRESWHHFDLYETADGVSLVAFEEMARKDDPFLNAPCRQ